MSFSISSIDKNGLICFLSVGIIVSLLFSPFFLSVGMILLAACSLVNWNWENNRPVFFFDPEAIQRLKNWRTRPEIISFTLIFLMLLISVWGLTDVDYWLDRLRLRVPFFVLPLVFLMLPPLKRRQWQFVLYFFVILSSLTAVVLLSNYVLHAESINAAIKRGQAFPTPLNHIRFSLLIALSIICAIYLLANNYKIRNKSQRLGLMMSVLFLFFFIHFLSVRTGLIALYAALFVLSLTWIIHSRKYAMLLVLVLGTIGAPVIAYQLVPSLRAKIDYVRFDAWKHQRGEGGLYADSGRIVSLKVGWQIFKEHPLLGTGVGGLRSEVRQQFAEQYPEYPHPLMPHNQYLYVAAATGILGLVLFVGAFFYPLFYGRNYLKPPLLALYVMLFTIFFLEHSIENSLGAGFAAFFLLYFLIEPEEEVTIQTA